MFLITSKHECLRNVYSESSALVFYILSTEVGGATLCSNEWKFGHKLQQEDSEGLANAINNIVNNRTVMDESNALVYEDLCYSYLVNKTLLSEMEMKNATNN